MKFNVKTTTTFIIQLLYYRTQGWFNNSYQKDYTRVQDYFIDRANKEWPGWRQDLTRIRNKQNIKKRRFQIQQSLFSKYSNTGIDPQIGLPIVSNEHQENFVKYYSTKSYSVNQVRRTPLGDIKVYRRVFFKSKATGLDIIKPGELVGISNKLEEELESNIELFNDNAIKIGEEAGDRDIVGDNNNREEEDNDDDINDNILEPSITSK